MSATQMSIPNIILNWCKGDEITSAHRNALSAQLAKTFNLPFKQRES